MSQKASRGSKNTATHTNFRTTTTWKMNTWAREKTSLSNSSSTPKRSSGDAIDLLIAIVFFTLLCIYF